MKKSTALKILKEIKAEISTPNPTVEGGYVDRFRESIKKIFGENSNFYDSAKKINFYQAHPLFKDELDDMIEQYESISACGIARDLLNSCIKYVNDFGVYKPPKKNFFEGLSSWRIIAILGGILVFGFTSGWTFASSVNIFSLFNNYQQIESNEQHPKYTKADNHTNYNTDGGARK